ncbi:RNA polymerase-binding protein DksA [Rhodoferax sp. BAB1]|uniref:RNA polymerase-binding protein DksA n=1 Tax=Rhodoferax sp. BAB1 TaxID=2741720 RepID=UPI0015769A84|nr:RNA polymerase-binding protein DksA [Rhodoferax sp. BAB1]QKO22927.1 RNA polymerase-binding protein DksA [Rhodoferax sp. BAB1]
MSSKAKSAVGKVKPAPKKAAAKPATKAKPAVKTAKPVAAKKAVSKPPAKKAAAKPAPKKTAAKPAAKKVAVKAAAPKKAVAKPAAKAGKTSAKAPVKAPAKTPVKAVVAKLPVKAPAPLPVKATPAMPDSPARTAKASARLAQLTVPSMAQSVASTAVKASYTPTMSQTLIAPPLPSSVKKDPKLVNNWKTKPGETLSDDELVAMPDSEYMNDKQLAAFRVRLQRLKQDILNNAGETTEHLREDTVIVPDPADRATIEEEHALELRTRDRERKLLKKIEQSIGRIDAGDYGYCDETGEPIGVGRLLARPTATLSLEAQQRRELKQKMFGD